LSVKTPMHHGSVAHGPATLGSAAATPDAKAGAK
jgi:hypothetical protein